MRTSLFGSRRATLIFALVVVLAAIVLVGSSDGATALVGSRTYTVDADFDEGLLFNVNHDAPNSSQLQLNTVATPFPFIWIPLSGRDTIAKVDTVTGTVLGEYLSAPDGRGRDPSRTTVDLNGNVWVGNRAESSGGQGSVVHIGLEESFQCVDRNDNGSIDTSTGLGDVRPWPNLGGVDDGGGVSSAEDECIIHYVRTSGTNVRTVAVDANNDLWVGGTGNLDHELIEGDTGTIVPGTTFNAGCGGYGGLVDGNGVLWSARGGGQLLRYDPATSTATCISVSNSYGLGVDSSGNVWNSQWTNNTITKIAPDGTIINTFPTGGSDSRGVAVTADDNIWVANSGSDTVTRLANNGTLLDTVAVGDVPTGVAVDAAGKVWVTNYGSDNAMRIDPAIDTVDLTVALGAGAWPYNYSDMTGMVSLGTTAPQGTWTSIFDSEEVGTEWGTVSWNTENLQNCPATPAEREPPGTSITARARSAETIAGLGAATYINAPNGVDIDPPDGRYVQVEVKLTPNDDGDSPIVCDVTIETAAPPPSTCPDFPPGETHDMVLQLCFDSIELDSTGDGTLDYSAGHVCFTGPGKIERSDPYRSGGYCTIDKEMKSAYLTATVGLWFAWLKVGPDQGLADPTTGTIVSISQEPGEEFPADNDWEVYFELGVDGLPGGDLLLQNCDLNPADGNPDPAYLVAQISAIPPYGTVHQGGVMPACDQGGTKRAEGAGAGGEVSSLGGPPVVGGAVETLNGSAGPDSSLDSSSGSGFNYTVLGVAVAAVAVVVAAGAWFAWRRWAR